MLALGPASAARAQSTAEAIAVRVVGEARLERGSAAPQPILVGTQLLAGDRVIVPARTAVVVLRRSGRMETLEASTTIAAAPTSTGDAMLAQTFRTIAQLVTTDARLQPNRAAMIRPGGGTPVPLFPRGGAKIQSATPLLIWSGVGTSMEFSVRLGARELSQTRVGRDTSWHVARPLERGVTYRWLPVGENLLMGPEATFTIASHADLNQLQARLAVIETLEREAGATAAETLRALTYYELGFAYDALASLHRLETLGQQLSTELQQLRANVVSTLYGS